MAKKDFKIEYSNSKQHDLESNLRIDTEGNFKNIF